MTTKPLIRCAVYTRKSHEEGLEQEYNSLDAQYDASASYVQSQRHEGWALSAERYDDGGFSGGNLERPGLKRLMADIQRGLIDVVVVYKIDRLSRSLTDFFKLVEVFDKHKVTFVSVTQHFNTTTSMGRLILNILLSFAQFEREITGERIRDKIAASKAKGMWTGGYAPIGYDLQDKKLVINEAEAETVRLIFEQFVTHGSPTMLCDELASRKLKTKDWTSSSGTHHPAKKIDKGLVYKVLHNPLYVGIIKHKDKTYNGQHPPLIKRELWDKAQRMLTVSPRKRADKQRERLDFMLRGILFDGTGRAMTPTSTRRKGSKLYRYYVSTRAIKEGYAHSDIKTVAAEEIESMVIAQVRTMVSTPEVAHRTHRLAHKLDTTITVDAVQTALAEFNGLWEQLFPLEKNRLIHLLIDRITVTSEGMRISYQENGIFTIYNEMKMLQGVA